MKEILALDATKEEYDGHQNANLELTGSQMVTLSVFFGLNMLLFFGITFLIVQIIVRYLVPMRLSRSQIVLFYSLALA